jgi:hypothetical protein
LHFSKIIGSSFLKNQDEVKLKLYIFAKNAIMSLYFWLTWLVLALILGIISKTTKLGFWGGFLISVFLTPIIGLMILLTAKPKKEKGK